MLSILLEIASQQAADRVTDLAEEWRSGNLSRPPLRYASAGVTKGRLGVSNGFVAGGENCRSLGFARDDKGEDSASLRI